MGIGVQGLINQRAMGFDVVQQGRALRLWLLGGVAIIHGHQEGPGVTSQHVTLELAPPGPVGGVDEIMVSAWPASLGQCHHGDAVVLWSVEEFSSHWLPEKGVVRVTVEVSLEGRGVHVQRIGYLVHLLAAPATGG